MTKKNFAIGTMILGIIIFLWNGYGLIVDKSPPKEEIVQKMKEEFAKHSSEMKFSDEKIEEMAESGIKISRVMTISFAVIGILLFSYGYYNHRKLSKLESIPA